MSTSLDQFERGVLLKLVQLHEKNPLPTMNRVLLSARSSHGVERGAGWAPWIGAVHRLQKRKLLERTPDGELRPTPHAFKVWDAIQEAYDTNPMVTGGVQ